MHWEGHAEWCFPPGEKHTQDPNGLPTSICGIAPAAPLPILLPERGKATKLQSNSRDHLRNQNVRLKATNDSKIDLHESWQELQQNHL